MFCASVSVPNRMELARKLESRGILYVRHHQQLKDALCGQMHFVLFSNKPNSTPDIFKQFLLALHFLFELAEARMNCLFVDLELFSDGHKKMEMPKVISNSLDVFPLIGVQLIKICGDQLVTADWVAKEAETLGVCIARASDDPKRIPSPVDQLLWPCHLPCPRAKKFGGKCRDDDNFWGCEQCGQTFKFAKQNEGKEPNAPITHLFCDCGGTRVDHLTFRCAFFAVHGVHFHAFTTLDLLNRELERQSKKDIVKNLLLLGKKGNVKSTLINAMHFYAQFETFEDALQLATLADFNSDSLAPASYSKSMLQNGKHVKIEAKLGGDTSRKTGQSQTQISAAYVIQPVEDGQTCCVIDTPGIDMDNQNMANTFGFLCEFDVLHGVGIMMEENDNRATNPFKYCINDGFLCNLHKNGAPNIVFLITHSSGSGKAIDVVGELLEEVEEKNGVKIPLDESNILCFNNAPFEALCLIKMKGVTSNEKEMRKFSEEWAESVQQFKRLLKHLATVKPHLTRETLSVCAARSAIVNIIPIIASNGKQIQKSIAKLEIEELEIAEWTKTIGEDKKKADIMFDNFMKKELGILRMLLHSDSMMRRNVVEDPPLLERVTEMRKEMIRKEAVIKQQLIEELNFCCKETAKWISCLKSMAVITDDDQMLRYIELSIRDADGKMAKLKGQSSREEQQKSIDALRKFKECYIKERTLFETASGNVEEFKFPTENVEQIFDGLFALEMTGDKMKANYEVAKKAKREHQRQFTAEEERRAAKQNLVKAEPTKCQSAEFDV